jgi:hypothetical protein
MIIKIHLYRYLILILLSATVDNNHRYYLYRLLDQRNDLPTAQLGCGNYIHQSHLYQRIYIVVLSIDFFNPVDLLMTFLFILDRPLVDHLLAYFLVLGIG